MTKDTLISGKSLDYNGKTLSFERPKIMGILNVTPDSFFDGGQHNNVNLALNKVEEMLDDGVDIIDIGGYSTRPGATHISEREELMRVLPVLKAIKSRFPELWVSIDTFRTQVAYDTILEGADMINDVSGGSLDSDMFSIVSKQNTPYILMHMRGTPQTMSQQNSYTNIGEDVVKEIQEKTVLLEKMGHNQIIIDPGFGFAKVGIQNFELMKALEKMSCLNKLLLVGISRKSMIYKYLGTTPDKALNGTTVLNTFALLHGANILRVHDVKEAVETVKLVQQLKK